MNLWNNSSHITGVQSYSVVVVAKSPVSLRRRGITYMSVNIHCTHYKVIQWPGYLDVLI